MDKTAAAKIIRETFEAPFDRSQYIYLVKNLFKNLDDRTEGATFKLHGQYITDAFKPYIKKYERVGKYEDTKGSKIDALIVYLQKETSLERARTMQRNFVSWYLKGSRGGVLKDAALVAFVSPDHDDWRFSLVKMEYHLQKSDKGEVKPEKELTPARRCSFLVGESEKSHTAKAQLLPLLEGNDLPTLAELEEAFSVEKVTKEFFEKYHQLFHDVKEGLDKLLDENPILKEEFENRTIDTADFAKKLLGQIVFLYFLQKKGWFGVSRDAEWGTGPKDFLRRLFEKEVAKYENFFNEILEPLFYEALATERSQDFYSRFNCKIPFLNGGLFDPLGDYDWVHTDILLPNTLFSNDEKTKEGDVGDGILDIFDRYNFTVKEDEPLEKEVAVDPEMLGKVFENLLEVKDRKSKGTYYTPREIVHYMCQESLINYLITESGLGEETIRSLVNPKVLTQEDYHKFRKKGGKKEEVIEGALALWVGEAEKLDKALANILVCDPACGSGAFLVGMLQEIVSVRKRLAFVLNNGVSNYELKKNAIANCLYGVDIDPGAVEIAKLRLWLSLVVDEEERRQIQPLPNLGYKIVCGNSLLGVQKNLFNLNLFTDLEKLKPLHLNEANTRKKQEYKKQIDDLIMQITNDNKNFDFEVYFSEVFHKKKGFDVVIANPPYVRQEAIKDQKQRLREELYEVYNSTSDLYTYFYERSYQILKPLGILTFISSNKWMRAKYGEKLRQFLKEKTKIIELIDFGGHKVFDATVDTNILIFQKSQPQKDYKLPFVNIGRDFSGEGLENYFNEKKQTISQKELSSTSWTLADEEVLALKKKIEKIGTPLKNWSVRIYRGITTGLNEVFIVDKSTANKLAKENEKSLEILKPILRGRDIKKWRYEFKGLYLIYSYTDIDIKKYGAIYEYLNQHKDQLEQVWEAKYNKKKWYELRGCDYYNEFEKEKIIYPETTQSANFTYDNTGLYLDKTAFFISGSNLKFLNALLGSTAVTYVFKKFYTGVDLSGSGYQYNKHALERFPIPKLPEKEEKPFVELLNKILAITKTNDYLENPTKQAKVKEYEKQIDQMVYKLYNLTPKEIRVVEEGGKT